MGAILASPVSGIQVITLTQLVHEWPAGQPAPTQVTYLPEASALRVGLANETTLEYRAREGLLSRVELDDAGLLVVLPMLPGIDAEAEAWMSTACDRLARGLPLDQDVAQTLHAA
jgi:hypothetical protein